MKTIAKKLIGYCGVDSGQILLVDPCYLHDWKNNEYTKDNGKLDFSYSGACQASLSKEKGGQLKNKIGAEVGVCISSGYGDGCYPVYVEYGEEGRVKRAIIEFFD